MRTPSYIGEVICTYVNPGNIPPYIHGMRVLPTEMSEVWAFEVDVEYAGGAILGIETRLEVRELDPEKSTVDSNSVGDVSSDLLEGFEYYGKQLNVDEGTVDAVEHKEESDPKPGLYELLLKVNNLFILDACILIEQSNRICLNKQQNIEQKN